MLLAYGKWCDKQDLNLRPQSYQDCALPIELLSQKACCAGHLTDRLLHDKRTDDFLVAGSFRYQHTGYLFSLDPLRGNRGHRDVVSKLPSIYHLSQQNFNNFFLRYTLPFYYVFPYLYLRLYRLM